MESYLIAVINVVDLSPCVLGLARLIYRFSLNFLCG